jgi:hypothetical protein
MSAARDILALACNLTQAEEQDRIVLRRLCGAAEANLRKRMRKDISLEECYDSFVSAAAMLAAADFSAVSAGLGVASFAAGPVSVSKADEASSRILREQAALLMAPFCQDAFCFLGVMA